LLARAVALFDQLQLDIISCRALDPDQNKNLLSSFPTKNCPITSANIFGIGMSISLFFRSLLIRNMRFDEKLGLGCPAGSGEETDFLIRAFQKSGKAWFFQDLEVYHAYPPADYSQVARKRASTYGLGYGIVLRRYFNLRMLPHFLKAMIIRPVGGMILSVFNPPRFLWCVDILSSRWKGFLKGNNFFKSSF
jgi:hypothetical protein